MHLEELVATWETVAATGSRLRKTEAIAATLARLPAAEIVPGVAYLSGELRQRQIGVGWAALRDAPAPADTASLQIGDVDAAFEQIGTQSGPGSTGRRKELLHDLFGRATPREQQFLRQLLAGELRQGALKGVMTEALAKAAEVPVAAIRRALLVRGDLRAVASAALTGGVPSLEQFRLTPGHALSPMLAATADDVAAALARISPAALEWKLDGVRIQVHRSGPEIRIFTRSLDDITARLGEVVEAVRALPVESIVLDGEVIALRPDGRPRPFQITASRVGAHTDAGAVALTAIFFDLLHLDGQDLLDRPESERFAALSAVVPGELLIPRLVTDDVAAAEAFFAETVRRGHEGLVVKDLQAPYDAGRRGSGWLKVKPRHTLDLVVLAAEWGHGRRRGRLSNLHLGARDPDGGGFVMLGKTFKGLTDAMLAWQTERLQELATDAGDWVVHVRPELVVEIAFDGVQRSSRYPGGLALRFARVKGYREDKGPDEADTIEAVREIHRSSGGEG